VERESTGSRCELGRAGVCLGREGEGSASTGSRGMGGGPASLPSCRPLRELDLRAALQDFCSRGAEAAGAGPGTALAPLWAAAYGMVEGLLLGVQDHLPGLGAEVRLEAPVQGAEPSASLVLRFARAPVVGDFATRSRVGFQLHLSEELAFSVRPPALLGDGLVLYVRGLAFVPLKETGELRVKLKAILGEEFSPASTYAWWENHKDEVCPLASSKMRWLVESILGLRSAQAVTPQKGKEKMIWGMMHTRTLTIEGFHFLDQEKRGVRVTSMVKPPATPEEEEMEAIYGELMAAMPAHELSMGEYFMPSSMNWVRLHCSSLLRQPGADPAKIRKLLSGARAWGPGEDGWRRWDDTWLCVDSRDAFGRAQEQGRTVWRSPESCETTKSPEGARLRSTGGPGQRLPGLGGQ